MHPVWDCVPIQTPTPGSRRALYVAGQKRIRWKKFRPALELDRATLAWKDGRKNYPRLNMDQRSLRLQRLPSVHRKVFVIYKIRLCLFCPALSPAWQCPQTLEDGIQRLLDSGTNVSIADGIHSWGYLENFPLKLLKFYLISTFSHFD